MDKLHAQQALCIGAQSGHTTLPGGTVRIPILELKFQITAKKTVIRRFLLDRRHPETLHAFLEHFLGYPIRLWELVPEMLVGQHGPLWGGPADISQLAAGSPAP